MQPLRIFSGTAAPFDAPDVNTDVIIPKQFLKSARRVGLGAHLFQELRYHASGAEVPDFVLNRPPYRNAAILVGGPNFGCGSSREHAVWALADFGIRCVVSSGFADIFQENCFKNGLLPAVVTATAARGLAGAAEKRPLDWTVDLEAQVLSLPDGGNVPFLVDGFGRSRLLEGLDEVGLVLKLSDRISSFEDRDRNKRPWLWGRAPKPATPESDHAE